jgi:hypothetical protein
VYSISNAWKPGDGPGVPSELSTALYSYMQSLIINYVKNHHVPIMLSDGNERIFICKFVTVESINHKFCLKLFERINTKIFFKTSTFRNPITSIFDE